MARVEMTITPAQLLALLQAESPAAGFRCLSTIQPGDAEAVSEAKLMPFFTEVARQTPRMTPLGFQEQAAMGTTLWFHWSKLQRKKFQVRSGTQTVDAVKGFFSILASHGQWGVLTPQPDVWKVFVLGLESHIIGSESRSKHCQPTP
eukprot:1916574-Amphidinium_carterae.1